MNVLSLFDGMSSGQIALQRAGITYDKYFASEIDKYAIQITQEHFPNTIQLGDVCNITGKDLPKIDLLIGGSPCQGFSFAGKQLKFEDSRSKLFFEYERLLKECKPKAFLLENVMMDERCVDVITESLGVAPVKINSAKFSAQNRIRLYWTNIPIRLIKSTNVVLRDIILDDVEPVMFSNIYGGFNETGARVHTNKSVTLRTPAGGGHISFLLLSDKAKAYMGREMCGVKRWDKFSNKLDGKTQCLCAVMYKGAPYGVIRELSRRMHPIECERLQTVPDNFTASLSNTQRYRVLGNGWTVDVIAHIFKGFYDVYQENYNDLFQMVL